MRITQFSLRRSAFEERKERVIISCKAGVLVGSFLKLKVHWKGACPAKCLTVGKELAAKPWPMQGHVQSSDRRVPELDGLRGAASIMVVISHYFGEVAHGISATTFGWIGVNMFFVLSGYLIGKLILEKKDCANFFEVFYVRRFLRIIPVYMVTLIGVL
ncbi:MAG TPA: acyltransferase, partial [Rhizomicrobium sp.]